MKKKYFVFLIVLTAIFSFMGGDCDEDTVGPLPITDLAPPSNASVVVDGLIGGSSFATITWTESTDEGLSDFVGYVVITDSVDSDGNTLGRYDSAQVAKNQANLHNVTGISRGVLYESFVYAYNNSDEESESSSTVIYSGIYVGSGSIDEFSTSTSTESAFGWDAETGTGTQYPYTSANSPVIDLHMREAAGQLTFYSPGAVPENPISNPKTTVFSLVGQGEDAFNKPIASYNDLTEPSSSSIGVTDENVYLLKTQGNIYIKVYVTSVSGGDFSNVEFQYKIQPTENLKALKR